MNFLLDPASFIIQWAQNLLSGWGVSTGLATFLLNFIGAGILSMGALFFVIFLIWLERKVAGRFQDRFGPNRVGPWGIIQPFADMIKIFTKEYITPAGADKVLFNLAPILKVGSTLAMWSVIPFAITFWGTRLNVGVLYLVAAGALGELGILMAGWSSNNKYALLGAFRVIAQLISYEVPMVLALLVPVLLARSMDLNDIAKAQTPWFVVTAPLAALIYFICTIAEVGRAPFDLIEAESELVAGFNIEYSGLKFGMFYVGEFLHAFTTALIFSLLFLGGWQGPGAVQYPILGFFYFAVKTGLTYFVTLWIRFSVPRFRIDQMMALNWKVLTPLALVVVAITALVDKLVAGSPLLIQVAALLIANLLILVPTLEILRQNDRRRHAILEDRLANSLPQEHLHERI